MKMLSKLLVAVFLGCILNLSAFAQSEKATLEKKVVECQKSSDWDCVVETSTKLIKLEPNNPTFFAGRGQANFELNKFDEAVFDMVLAGKDVPVYQYISGRISIAKGDRKSATSFFMKAASDLNNPNHKTFQTALDLAQDSTKTDQDLREKYGSGFCRSAYKVDKDYVTKNDLTIAMAFINEGDIAGLRKILPCKFDLNKQNKKAFTALSYASAMFTDPVFVNELIKYGADPNFVDSDTGVTALHLALVKPDKPEIVRALLNAGASPTAKDKNGHDPMYFAKTYELTESAKLIQAALDKLPKGK